MTAPTRSRSAVILGAGSDIGRMIMERLVRDGWSVASYRHDQSLLCEPWDLVVCCYGTLEPIGSFWGTSDAEWERAVYINALLPLRQIKMLYPHRRPGASVCLFSGAGANGSAPTYSAYCASKIMLTKMVELMDAESEDCKFFILGPGMMRTKIQEQTLQAGERAANIDRVRTFMESDDSGTSGDDVYACLMACMTASKAAVGGRNIYVPADDWSRLDELEAKPGMFTLRRKGNGGLRKRSAKTLNLPRLFYVVHGSMIFTTWVLDGYPSTAQVDLREPLFDPHVVPSNTFRAVQIRCWNDRGVMRCEAASPADSKVVQEWATRHVNTPFEDFDWTPWPAKEVPS